MMVPCLTCDILKLNVILALALVSGWSQSVAQEWKLIRSFQSQHPITTQSFDRQNNLYIATEIGEIVKLSAQLRQIQKISVPNQNSITLVEARNALTPFIFSRGNQEAMVFDRFLARPTVYPASQFVDRFVWTMTTSVDQHFWLFQNSPPSIQKVDRNLRTILQDSRLPLHLDLQNVTFFGAYRGILLLVDAETGLYLFDLFGNELARIETQGASYGQLQGSSVITCNTEKLFSLNLNSQELDTLSTPGKYSAVLSLEQGYYFIGQNRIDLYQLVN